MRAADDTERGRRDFRALLVSELTSRGLSQAVLGQAVGVSGSAVGGWVRGPDVPRREHAQALDSYFGFTDRRISRLLGYAEIPKVDHERLDTLEREVAALRADISAMKQALEDQLAQEPVSRPSGRQPRR